MGIFVKNRSFFENLFASKEDPWWFSWRATQQYRYSVYLKMLDHFFKNKKGKKVFDIGCAQGDFTYMLYKTQNFSEVVGADISQRAIDRANERFTNSKGLSFIRKTLPDIPFEKASLSLICMLEVIYYIPHRQRLLALSNAHKSLEKDGLLFLSTNLGKNYFEEEEFKQLVTNAGFKIELTHRVYGMVYWNFEHYPLSWYESLRKYEIKTHSSPFYTRIPIKLIKALLGSFKLFELGAFIGEKILREKPCLLYIIARKVEK